MLRDYWLVILTYKKAILYYWFRIKRINPQLYYSGFFLIEKSSFRLPESSKKDFFISFRIFKNILHKIFINKLNVIQFNDNGIAIFDENLDATENRKNYVEKLSSDKIGLVIGKSELLFSKNLIHAFILSIVSTIIAIPSFLFVFSKKRANYALIISEIIESINLLYIIKKYRIKKLHYFCIYQNDANICAAILMRRNIIINKISSEVPLVFANKVIVANTLALCFKYQQEEYEAFKSTMFVESTQQWIPEEIFGYIEKYIKPSLPTPSNTIGFYSSGFWKRIAAKHSLADVGPYESEKIVLEYLNLYLSTRPHIKLIIFPHPLEKRNEAQYKESQEYYSSILKQNISRIEIASFSTKTIHTFNTIDIAISMFSTIMFERIFCGFKSILVPIGYNDFPLKKSSFQNICAKNKEDLFQKLDLNLTYTQKEFFEKNNLKNYTFESYLE